MTLQRKIFYIIGATWIAVTLIFLMIGLQAGEARMGAFLLMMYLGFPSALVIPSQLADVAKNFDIVLFLIDGNTLNFLLSWLVLFLLGFIQWFVLVPFLCRKFNRLAKWSSKLP